MEWKRSEVPWHVAVNTKRVCGKEFLVIDRRGEGPLDVELKWLDCRQCMSAARHGSIGWSVSATVSPTYAKVCDNFG